MFSKICLPLLLLAILVPGCLGHHNRPGKKPSPAAPDTVHLEKLVRSFEPRKFRGKVPEAYYTNRGFHDYWRFPIVYPYAISCVDVLDYGALISEEGLTDYKAGGGNILLTPYFDQFTFDRSYFVGKHTHNPFDASSEPTPKGYFIFSFSNGQITEVADSAELPRRLKAVGFSAKLSFSTIRAYARNL